MTDPISDAVRDTVGDQAVGRRLPRALTPFRTPAYRSGSRWRWSPRRSPWGSGSSRSSGRSSGSGAARPPCPSSRPRAPSGYCSRPSSRASWPTGSRSASSSSPSPASSCTGMGGSRRCCPPQTSTASGSWRRGFLSPSPPARPRPSTTPRISAWLPALVPESDLQAVNGFEGMVRPTVGQAIGPAVAGAVLVAAASPGTAFTVATAAGVVTVLGAARRCRRRRSGAPSTPGMSRTLSARRWWTCARASSTWCARRGCSPPCCSPR